MTTMQKRTSLLILVQLTASVLALLVWFFADNSWLGFMLSIGFGVATISILANRDNLLFFFRTVFIAWIGLVPALALYMGGYFAWRLPFIQTLDVAFIMSIITILALFSSQLGIEAGPLCQDRCRVL